MSGEVDLSSISIAFGGDESIDVQVWLRTQQLELEDLIEPCLSNSPTPFTLQFKGEKRHLDVTKRIVVKGLRTGRVSAGEVGIALSHIYRLSHAIEARDISGIITHAYGFARSHEELDNIRTWGMTSAEGMAGSLRNKTTQATRRKGKGLLSDKEKSLVVSFIKTQAIVVGSAARASDMAAKQLRTGTFKGVKRQIENIEASTLRGYLYTKPKKLL
jgi:hypothetical protein